MNRFTSLQPSALLPSLVLAAIIALSIFPLSLLAQQNDAAEPPGKLDSQEPLIVSVYRLMYADPGIVKDVAGSLHTSNPIRMAIDPRTNSLIVQADVESLNKLEALIQKLDRPEEAPHSQVASPVNLVVQLITDFEDETSSIPLATPVDSRVAEILVEAASAGLIRPMKQPHAVTHSLISVKPGLDPNSGGGRVGTASSAAEERINIELNGTLIQQNEDTFQLSTKIQIQLRDPVNSPEDKAKSASAQIQTDTMLIKNHPVMLSVNTIEGRNFLVLVEVR